MPKNPDQKRKDTAVKVESEIAWKAKALCAFRKITVAEFLSDILRDPVDREFAKYQKEVAKWSESQ